MIQKAKNGTQDFQAQAEEAVAQGEWQTAAELYARCVEQRSNELALINSVQGGLSSRLDMQSIYDLVGDKLRDTFNAQVVMISQYDQNTKKIFHHYAIERGQHLRIPGWSEIDSSRATIVRTRKPFMINAEEIIRVVTKGSMHVVPGTELPKTWLGVPMLVGKDVVGIVSLQNLDKENAFSKSDINLLMTLTNSMSLSLENARLFSETQRLLRVFEEEMKIARRTQRSILPKRVPRRRGYDFGALVMPARLVGGDFYDFIYLGQSRLSLVIGDVSDKGLPAALSMAQTASLLRLGSEHSDNPSQLLRNVNHYLLKRNAPGMFVTLIYGILDCRTGELSYTRAGHPPPVVLNAQGEVIKIPMLAGQPLGLFDSAALDVQEVVLPPGGLILLYSDGLSEAADPQGQEFGVGRIVQVLSDQRLESASQICHLLWEAMTAHSGEMHHQDDFVTVVVKRLA
jgi:serine phosphatase RsbU (regulator of sigma subunit)